LEALTGVKQRRLWPIELNPSHFATKVGEKLLAGSQRKAQDIDLLVFTGVCRDFIEPATSHIIHHKLKLRDDCLSFDLSNACVGFFNGLVLSAQLIESGQIRNALVVSGENAAPLLERTINVLLSEQSEEKFRYSLASLTLGSGAVACLMTHSSQSSKQHRFLGGVSQLASQHYELCQGQGDYRSPLMKTDSRRLLKEGVELSVKTWSLFLEKMNCTADSFDHVFTHQVSVAHQDRICQELSISPGRGRKECELLGNTGSVAAPLSLALAEEEGRLRTGDQLALLGIGSGLNSMMLGIQW
jgi:3-oxoacyl-[acyl-carrier-protein] synthase-3